MTASVSVQAFRVPADVPADAVKLFPVAHDAVVEPRLPHGFASRVAVLVDPAGGRRLEGSNDRGEGAFFGFLEPWGQFLRGREARLATLLFRSVPFRWFSGPSVDSSRFGFSSEWQIQSRPWT